jgi:hypothetical protein
MGTLGASALQQTGVAAVCCVKATQRGGGCREALSVGIGCFGVAACRSVTWPGLLGESVREQSSGATGRGSRPAGGALVQLGRAALVETRLALGITTVSSVAASAGALVQRWRNDD